MSFRIDPDRIDRRQLVPALILIAIGILGLFGTFGWLGAMGGLVGAILFGAAAYFAYLQGRHTGKLGWHIAAFPLAGLAIASIAPEALGGFAFLGSIGAAFALVWRDDARRWWAVIPAGTFFSLALTALVDGSTRSAGAGGSVFLFGLAATFFVLTRLPQHPQGWAVFPAAVLAILAVIALTTSGGWIFPLLLILAGAWMLLRPGAQRGTPTSQRPVSGTSVTAPPAAPGTVTAAPPAAPGSVPSQPAAPTAPVAPAPAPEAPAATPPSEPTPWTTTPPAEPTPPATTTAPDAPTDAPAATDAPREPDADEDRDTHR